MVGSGVLDDLIGSDPAGSRTLMTPYCTFIDLNIHFVDIFINLGKSRQVAKSSGHLMTLCSKSNSCSARPARSRAWWWRATSRPSAAWLMRCIIFKAGHKLQLPRQRDHVFRPLRPSYFSHFCSKTFSRSWQLVACPALIILHDHTLYTVRNSYRERQCCKIICVFSWKSHPSLRKQPSSWSAFMTCTIPAK